MQIRTIGILGGTGFVGRTTDNFPDMPVTVLMGNILDGVSPHMKDYPGNRSYVVTRKKPCNVAKVLKQTEADILISYLPVGSEKATAYYSEACLKFRCELHQLCSGLYCIRYIMGREI